MPSACGSLAFTDQPPLVRATTAFGQGLGYRFVLTPQVWAITGDGLSLNFDGRTVDASDAIAEVAHATTIGGSPVRFKVLRPVAGGIGLNYARQTFLSTPADGSSREYQCIVGITTRAADVATSPSGPFARTVVAGTAYVREGTTSRGYSLRASIATLAVDFTARSVTLSLQLTGTPVTGGGGDINLGSYTATGPINAANDNFVATLNSSTRTVTGTISGRFFGPQAVEVGAAFGASVAESGTAPGFSVIGTVHGAR